MKKLVKEDYMIIQNIIDRAEELKIMQTKRISAVIDICLAAEQFEMNLKDFYESDDFNFTHDFVGIQNNINRETKEFENYFVPRFAEKVSELNNDFN